MYTEEVDLCYRLKMGGWVLCYVPQAKVVHYGGQSASQIAEEMFIRLYESKLIFMKKYYGWLITQVYRLILFVAALTRLFLIPIAWLEKQPQRQQNLLTLASHYRRLLTELPHL
jgi:GT2 family glycosyltransferase